jgi:hypothetical protein
VAGGKTPQQHKTAKVGELTKGDLVLFSQTADGGGKKSTDTYSGCRKKNIPAKKSATCFRSFSE